MSFFSPGNTGILSPEQIADLVVVPLQRDSVGMQVSSVVQADTQQFRFPILTDNPAAAWTAEGGTIAETEPDTDELVVTPRKLTCLVKVSRELAADSVNPGAATMVGEAITSQLQQMVDKAFFGSNVGNTAVQPPGLADLVGVQTVTIGGSFTDLTWAVTAESLLQRTGCTATAFVASSATCDVLAKLPKFTGSTTSKETLLQADPTAPTKYQVNGVPLYWVPQGVIPDGTVWALSQRRSYVVMRQDVELEASPYPYWNTDSIGVRAIMRIGFAWPVPQSVVKIVGVLPGS